jgi:S1-C subfamily serine protease
MDIKNSVFKVNTIRENRDYSKPWQTSSRSHGSGSAFALELDSKYIFITNAHVVEKAINITLDMNAVSYLCDTKYIIPEYDLAIIEPKQEIPGVKPLSLGNSPKQLERVIIAGFPYGGDNISTTEGVVSRIDAVQYYRGVANNIAILVDAAVNPGNSGGPALNSDNKVAGVAFSGKTDAQNMNYIIPNVILKLFIRLYTNKFKWEGISTLPIETRDLLNKTLRKTLKIPNETTGVVITKLVPRNLGIITNEFKVEDVIIKINEHKITNNSKIQWNDQFIDYNLYINILQPGTVIDIELIRDEKLIKLKHKLLACDTLVPVTELYTSLESVIISGLVFLPLSYPLIHSFDESSWGYLSNLVKVHDYIYNFEEFPSEYIKYGKQQIVLLTEIIPNEHNRDYEPYKRRLISVDGKKIYNLKHLQDLTKNTKIIKLEFERDFMYIHA